MYAIYLLAGLYVLYIYYLAVMHLKHLIDEGKATKPMRVIGYGLILPPALFVDWAVNIMLSVPFLDLPGGNLRWNIRVWKMTAEDWKSIGFELVTGRLKRYTYEDYGALRRKAASWFATILDAADPSGKHI